LILLNGFAFFDAKGKPAAQAASVAANNNGHRDLAGEIRAQMHKISCSSDIKLSELHQYWV
jgi:hypothetical protein